MKKNLALLLSAFFMADACAAPTSQSGEISDSPPASVTAETDAVDTSVSESDVTEPSLTVSETEQTTREETSAEEKTEPAEAQPAQKYIDENGLLNDAAKERIDAILTENETGTCSVYPGLFDFDRDGVPELYLVFHNGGQGYMPIAVYTLDGDRFGEFVGYCRDGFCRFSYGDDCVYVHNKYEHSMHTSCELVTRLTVEDGVLSAEDILHKDGNVGDSFPLKNYTYFVNGESAEKEAYYGAYWDWNFDDPGGKYVFREANEFSLCTYDLLDSGSIDDSERTETVVSLYNQYVAGKNAATERFGYEPSVFAFDDYDRDGSFEAFVAPKFDNGSHSDIIYFWKNGAFTEIPSTESCVCEDYTRIGDLFVAQPAGNGSYCAIYGVRDGEFYKHKNSSGNGYGMLIRPGGYFPFEGYVNGEFVLYDSTFEPYHMHKPYFFTYPCEEIVAEPVTEADFSDREDVLAVLDELKAELSAYPENAEIVGMYLRGGEYLHVNYTEPVETWDEGNMYFPIPHYRTYMIQNKVVQIDEGDGHYTARLGGDE